MVKDRLNGELALITGSTGGIGKATACALASKGCDIAVHYNTASDTASTLVRDLSRGYNVKARAFQADLSKYDDVRRLHAEVAKAMGSPSVLFNNAGLTLRKTGVKDIQEISVEDFETTWRANCGSTFLLTQLCLPHMEQKGWGKVVFCSSVAGFTGGVVGPHYASSKSALHGLIHWLSQAYCRKGIAVNGVAPALIQDTKMLPGNNDELAQTQGLQATKEIPMGILGRPEEVAEAVLWIVRASYVTNKVIGIDGGMYPY